MAVLYTGGALPVVLAIAAERIQELREWGEGLAAHAQALECELYGEPDSGLSMG